MPTTLPHQAAPIEAYNQRQPHDALKYCSPMEYQSVVAESECPRAPGLQKGGKHALIDGRDFAVADCLFYENKRRVCYVRWVAYVTQLNGCYVITDQLKQMR